MFTYRTKVRLKETDATGVLYFAEQLKMALEAFEEFLDAAGFPLRKLIDSPVLFPVVHAEADYFAPVQVGDELEISLEIEKLGTSSVTIAYRLHDVLRRLEVGTAKIVHVAVERTTRSSVPIPDFLREIFLGDEASSLRASPE